MSTVQENCPQAQQVPLKLIVASYAQRPFHFEDRTLKTIQGSLKIDLFSNLGISLSPSAARSQGSKNLVKKMLRKFGKENLKNLCIIHPFAREMSPFALCDNGSLFQVRPFLLFRHLFIFQGPYFQFFGGGKFMRRM